MKRLLFLMTVLVDPYMLAQELGWSWKTPGAEDFSPVPADALYCR